MLEEHASHNQKTHANRYGGGMGGKKLRDHLKQLSKGDRAAYKSRARDRGMGGKAGGSGKIASPRQAAVRGKERKAYIKKQGDKAEKDVRSNYEVRLDHGTLNTYSLVDKRRKTSAGYSPSLATGSKSEMEKKLNSRVKTARTKAENDAKSFVDNFNRDLDRGFYDNETAAIDRERFFGESQREGDMSNKSFIDRLYEAWDTIQEAIDAMADAFDETDDVDDQPAEESATEPTDPITESAVDVAFVPLVEKAVRADGTIPVKLIQPGWGSSGYYPAKVLERDGPQIFKAGTKMYLDHPTPTEEAERPERSVRDLAAILTNDARWHEQGHDGPGLYADAKVIEGFRDVINAVGPHIGVSIRAMGKAKHGEAEGRKGAIVEAITSAKSVDFVTEPGAGGRILQLFEAARPQPRTNAQDGQGENNVELEARIKELEAENARLKEAQIVAQAGAAISNALTGLDLPAAVKERLTKSLSVNVPTLNGALDVAKFNESIKAAVAAELDYLKEAAGYNPGKITGMGGAGQPAAGTVNLEEVRKRQDAAFAAMGYGQRNGK